jgi:hypothetical protein
MDSAVGNKKKLKVKTFVGWINTVYFQCPLELVKLCLWQGSNIVRE